MKGIGRKVTERYEALCQVSRWQRLSSIQSFLIWSEFVGKETSELTLNLLIIYYTNNLRRMDD